jgi:hypothetical protein
MTPRYLTPKEASRYINTKYGVSRSPNTLAKLRSMGGSPAYYTIGRHIYYLPQDLDEWIVVRILGHRTSTSDLPYEVFDLDNKWRTRDPTFGEITPAEYEAMDAELALAAKILGNFNCLVDIS